ncbi:1D-myo-inositol 2-acetamido-2-deoxy-alpha-D-glucopyranoside deacetylase [Microlunatus endophyticus]|uniref:N-acetyl-1-D-myo-inositol-2-amino-2-deoxy-alpha-D-glucopyranoside deacetylase n=1 Tax=Microlunatus endophyticus TaxID=1716077 RepID=A0A917S0T5_9ACTN|nr:N-acetyl-1-D-myo-inositol-2-amino-2-deoxy-alpha-D-glucopyranoside deacetylase [Microlunatus endophyticus]GGL47423.1 1D-myo-inositol 2-acetamido-2-deoxy-alpha-D-glucopyranoside deacetylase [Microlunatus endophyticus]
MTSETSAPELADRRLLVVHAHPDDESIGTGITMAKYVAEGAAVTLVTCTLGEEGEVLVPELEHLGAEHEDRLGPHRLGELHEAMTALGVTDYVRLGGDYRFRDSGMKWSEDGRGAIPRDVLREGIFWTTDLLEAASELVAIIRDRRPQVLITQDERGAYGHPDHIQAHRVATYAYALAGVPGFRPDLGEPWTVDRVVWASISESRMRDRIRTLRAMGDTESFNGVDPDVAGSLPMGTPDEWIVAEIVAPEHIDKKMAALHAYKTQIAQESWFFQAAAKIDDFWAAEHYRYAGGKEFPQADKWADDLFAGLD